MEEDNNVNPDANRAETTTPETGGGEQAPEVDKPIATPQNELYAALQEERLRRKEREKKLKEAEENKPPPPEPAKVEHSEEGLAIKSELQQEIGRLEGVVKNLQGDLKLKDVLSKHPVLNDNLVEFDDYRQGYPGLDLDKVAMVFLTEKGLLAPKVRRVGLEQPQGGTQVAPSTKMTVEELEKLRTDNPRQYIKMLRKGEIKLSEIKRE